MRPVRGWGVLGSARRFSHKGRLGEADRPQISLAGVAATRLRAESAPGHAAASLRIVTERRRL